MRRHAVCRQFTNTCHATNQSSMMLWCELKHLCVCVCVCVCARAGYGTVEQREKPPRNESFTQRDASWNLSLTYVGASCRQLDFMIILERARWLILGSGLKSCLKYKTGSGCLEALARPLAVFLFVCYVLYLDNCFFYVYVRIVSWYLDM